MATATLRPNAAGDLTEWHSQYPDSNEHWDKVSEEPADDDTYVYCTGPLFDEKRDLYNLPASTGSGTINFIKIYIRCKSDVLGDITVYPSLKSNSTVSEGGQHNFSTIWETYSFQFGENPADGQPWEWADIDALQIGIMNTYLSGAPEIAYCSQVYVEVDYTPTAGLENKSAGMGAKMIAGKLI